MDDKEIQTTLGLIEQQASLIDDIQRIAKDASENISKKSQLKPEDLIILNFSWLREKFRFFWFESTATEMFIQKHLPNVSLFNPVEFELLVRSILYLIEERIYNTTPTSGDGGVDLYFDKCIDETWNAYSHTVVQCKLYRASVPVSEIRDFFGVMVARTAKGIFVTTGSITDSSAIFLNSAQNSSFANRLHIIDGQYLRKLLEIADQIHEVLDAFLYEEQDHESQEELNNKLKILRHKGRNVLYGIRNHPIQGKLF